MLLKIPKNSADVRMRTVIQKYYMFIQGRDIYWDTLRTYACGAKENVQKL